MARHRTYSLEFKRQVAQEYLSGEASLHGLAKRHDIARNLIRIWVEKYEAGAFDDDQVLAGTLEAYEAKIAALERKVGQLTMELDLLKKGQRFAQRQTSVNSSVVSGPRAAASREDAGS
jgi:transposase